MRGCLIPLCLLRFKLLAEWNCTRAKIARIAYGIVCNHPFMDGNKRIGVYLMMVLLELNHIDVDFTNADIVRIGLELANGKMSNELLLKLILARRK
jgi:death-on-curing protein